MRGYATSEDGDVVLTMSPNDYEGLLLALGFAAGKASRNGDGCLQGLRRAAVLGLANRLNAGNSQWRTYDDEGPED